MAVAAESKWRRADHKQQMDDDGADRDEGVARAVACVPADPARQPETVAVGLRQGYAAGGWINPS
jgi:hypothetical protein